MAGCTKDNYWKGHFSFPSLPKGIPENGEQKVAVISVFGKTSLTSNGCKASALEMLIGCKVFERSLLQPIYFDEKTYTGIEGFYDPVKGLLILHLEGLFDSLTLLTALEKMNEQLEKGFLVAWSELKLQFARSLIFLFSVSHILLLCHPTHVFDISYILLFRTLDIIRSKSVPWLSEILKDVPDIGKDWVNYGRLCSPRVLFLFSSSSLHHSIFRSNCDRGPQDLSQGRTKGMLQYNSLRKLELALEDQIYKLLRKSRVITNISANSLFAVPYNQSYVYILEEHQEEYEGDKLISRKLDELCGFQEHNFHVFLKQHIDLALGRGFDDNVGRHSGPSFFEVSKVKTWFNAASLVYEFFTMQSMEEDSNSNNMLSNLKNLVDTEIRFSESRCSKALPYAIDAYKEGLPPHYTNAQHQTRLSVAFSVLALHARGPKYCEYEAQLEESCHNIWLDGRVGCEVLSLTGNTCQHPRHATTSDAENESDHPVLSHKSGILYPSYCNCGRSKSQMEDPFSAKMANFDFFNLATCRGCQNKFEFPVFKSSANNAKAAEISLAKEEDKDPQESLILENVAHNFLTHGSGSSCLSPTVGGAKLGLAPEDFQDVITLTTVEKKEKSDTLATSGTEYLPYMLHTQSPPGLLSQYSSWSLVLLGPSSLYSHNIGIQDQPGFISGTNFLLPWDVTVKVEDKDKWPAIADCMGKKGFVLKNKKNRNGGELNEFTVKIFLGVEYQCLRGHRFMMASPDKPLKATHGIVKDTASKVANSDMPLYFQCLLCSRSGSVMNGQLMRIHVVTPKAPVHVTLNPHVQPAPEPSPKFIPVLSNSAPIKLSPSAYWVLRFPFIYAGENGPYCPDHRQPVSTAYAKLLKGCYGITQVFLNR